LGIFETVTSYCQNRVIIEGSAAEIRGFAHDCLSLRDELYVLDFQKILPMPSIVEGLYRSIPSKLGGKYPDEFSSGWVGMEALLRKPPPSYEGEVARPDSVLTRDVVKKVGIRNYDDLNRWLNQNDPASLDLGRKCLAAFEACGNFFEDDWVGDKWGCDPERVDYSKATMSETRYEAEFESPYGAPEGICREIVRRHPGLKSRFVALETGNDYAFVLTAKDGHTREERPEITDTLIDEVEGPGTVEQYIESERAFYERPSVLREQPTRHIRYWLRERQLKRALVGYPLYAPPHSGVEWTMPATQARGNFDFFVAQRRHRIDVLKRFLAPFNVSLDFTDGAKQALDRWLAAYGALLFVSETGISFLTHEPEWTGPRASLNVIFDIGIYLGEFAIAESPWLRWDMDVRREPGRTRRDHRFQRPIIGAAEDLFSFPRDVIYDVHQICHSLCEASYMWKESRYKFGSRPRSRHFITKTLRHIYLCARGEFETANNEVLQDSYVR
jgi:hypothetical protein